MLKIFHGFQELQRCMLELRGYLKKQSGCIKQCSIRDDPMRLLLLNGLPILMLV